WAMTHFLVFATDPADPSTPKYRSRLIEMLRLVHSGKAGDVAFEEAFGDNLPGFQRRFLEYAATLRATPKATCIERQQVLASMLSALKSHGKRFESVSGFRRTVIDIGMVMRCRDGDIEWKTECDPRLYFTDLCGRLLFA